MIERRKAVETADRALEEQLGNGSSADFQAEQLTSISLAEPRKGFVLPSRKEVREISPLATRRLKGNL